MSYQSTVQDYLLCFMLSPLFFSIEACLGLKQTCSLNYFVAPQSLAYGWHSLIFVC